MAPLVAHGLDDTNTNRLGTAENRKVGGSTPPLATPSDLRLLPRPLDRSASRLPRSGSTSHGGSRAVVQV